MYYPMPEPRPEPELVQPDRLAVAIGNASLLGVGYLLLGRQAWAAVTTLITVVLVVLLGTVTPGAWFEVLFMVWWVALIAHGWHLAGTPARPTAVRWPKAIALMITVPVLVGVGFLQFDATDIDDEITEARDSGDCGKAQSAVDRIWFGHHVVDGPVAARGERTAEACARLRETGKTLAVASAKPDPAGLRSAYHELGAVLTDLPGHDRMVGSVLDGFLAGLPGHEPCDTAALTDWIRQRQASDNVLDRSADVLPRLAPAALVGCGDKLNEGRSWQEAHARFQQMLDQYPGHELTAKAQEGLKKARQGLELQHIYALNDAYCQKPAIYSGAAPYAKGATNRAVVYHADKYDDMYLKKVPAEWRADLTQAVMIVCIGGRTSGAPIRSCPYRGESDGRVRTVTFSKMAFPVKAYELRTGNVVIDTKVEIGGAVCPPRLSSFGGNDPLRMVAEPSDADIRAAFAPVFTG
ncbi:hypothetical protein [Kibdelosporangium phytohabitans]|uniref:Uncharacterized protein n=1 Tax=Kibdelosporangium phytohabitans TaxID=860235 RepID=A0A0N9I603_9PSEU|nr:hypothetical protein [Kibdelosporangium phytohabitans]ALG10016.1 hypothetical protein AOZ06_26735 [Kibdelosporangium phytohabitans]MBE1468557.1 hypothetical protein [Kibdelosporangium phytohabitans]